MDVPLDERVERRTLSERPTAVVVDTVAVGDVGPWISSAFGRVAAVLAAQRVEPAGPPYARYFDAGDRRFRVEAGFPVRRAIDPEAGVVPSTLPGGDAATTVHAGPYERIGDAHDRLAAWCDAHGLADAGAPWEVYLTDPTAVPDPAAWRTEVVVPLHPATTGGAGATGGTIYAGIAEEVISARQHLAAALELLERLDGDDERTPTLIAIAATADEAVIHLEAALMTAAPAGGAS